MDNLQQIVDLVKELGIEPPEWWQKQFEKRMEEGGGRLVCHKGPDRSMRRLFDMIGRHLKQIADGIETGGGE